MAIWTQIGDERVSSIPPDGRTKVDVYARFSFSNAPLPEGAVVNFAIGKGELPQQIDSETARRWTVSDILGSLTPVEGIFLVAEDGQEGFQCRGTVREYVVRNQDGELGVQTAAKCSIAPMSDPLEEEITVIAYTDYDRLGQVQRLQPDQVSLTIMSGEGVFLAVNERYDPVSDEWTTLAPMKNGRAGLFMESVGGMLYAIGGFGGNFTGAVEEYDPSSDSWEDRTPLPAARGYGAGAVHGGKIYVIGGYNYDPGRASNKAHRYDPTLDQWEALADMPLPVGAGAAAVVGNSIYVVGGATLFEDNAGRDEAPKSFNFAVLKYDITAGTWFIEDVDTSPVAAPASSAISEASTASDVFLRIAPGSQFPPYGILTVDRGGANEETAAFSSFDSSTGWLTMSAPLSLAHAIGEAVEVVSLPENRLSPNVSVSGTSITIFNGMSYAGFTNSAPSGISATVSSYDTATRAFSNLSTSPFLPRLRAGHVAMTVGASGRTYVVGGSAEKSDFLNDAEYLDVPGGSFAGGLSDMLHPRHSIGLASTGAYAYAVGGGGSGHPPGWLRIEVAADPASVRADGKQTSGVVVSMLDASGDPPPDGTLVEARGVVFMALSEDDRAARQEATSGSTEEPSIADPTPVISLLPVVFSSRTMLSSAGMAATTLLGRSEDSIREVENLFGFAVRGESVPPEGLTQPVADLRHAVISVGDQRPLYSISVEISVVDDFYFGRTDTQAAIAGLSSQGLSSASSGYDFNPDVAKQGLSANVSYYSDIASIPDVLLVTAEPVDADDAREVLVELGEEVPFGASPHYDAMVAGARARAGDHVSPPAVLPSNIMVTASDNDENLSSYSPTDVVEEANDIGGNMGFPVFVTTFIVTDPISLAARRARTDVAALELISSETGGNSFSVVDPSYVGFVITRIKTSAPASLGSGSVSSVKELDGSLTSILYSVEGVPGNPGAVAGYATNSASMRIWSSGDNYNFEELDLEIPPNVEYVLPEPMQARFVKYRVVLRSQTFDSPILRSVALNFTRANVQFLFTLPQTVSGQVSEISIMANHRLPDGGVVDAGIFHGNSVMFDRDYSSSSQPSVRERGTIMAINRSFDTFVGENLDQSTRDRLETDDFLVYRSRSGGWSQEGVTRVFVNELEALPEEYISFPEDGLVAFRRRLSELDEVGIEVQMPDKFRVGLKIANPSTAKGKFDEFAYMYGITEDDAGLRPNNAPRATNLFVGSPVFPGGPLVANYTFSDSDGNDEDGSEINWFRDGALLPELRNLKTVTNSNLVAKRADVKSGLISKGQEWFFTVRPSDGKSFGPIAVSSSVTVSNLPPVAENLRIESMGEDPLSFISSSGVVARFDFVDQDKGDEQGGSNYTWFVNGVEVKSGSSNGIAPDEKGTDGRRLLSPNNVVRVELVPSDKSDFGASVSSDAITMTGSPPTASDVKILPETPSASSILKVTYVLTDFDNGQDISDIAWFRNGQRVSELDNAREVNPLLTAPGQQWQAVVTPRNEFVSGEAVRSNVALIRF